jgi:carboxymethylenebutenolidase
MPGEIIRITSSEGGQFDAFLATPASDARVPAMVIASAVFGVTAEVRRIAEELAAKGFLALAPDLFWRTMPGPLPRDDKRAAERAQPRLERLRTGEADLVDALAAVRRLPQSNGRAAIMGLCYGGPYAVVGPKRLGYDAGIGCHASEMLPFVDELRGLSRPVQIVWGDQDHAAPPPVLEAYRVAAASSANLRVEIFPGRLHGFMMRDNAKAYDQEAYDFSMKSAFELLESLR